MIATRDLDEKVRLGRGILASQADNLWVIGTVGEVPLPMPRNNKLHNFPERGGHDWSIGSWTGPQHPSQFYLVQEWRATHRRWRMTDGRPDRADSPESCPARRPFVRPGVPWDR